MQDDKSIMRFEKTLPSDFTGTFPFTNPSDEDFIGLWGGKEYFFPAKSTVPLIIPEHSPIEIQHIRKKLAKDLAEREFYKSKEYKTLSGQEGKTGNRIFNSIHQAATYTLKDLEPYIKQCIEPMTPASLRSMPAAKVNIEDKLSRNDKDELNTEVITQNVSLVAKAKQS